MQMVMATFIESKRPELYACLQRIFARSAALDQRSGVVIAQTAGKRSGGVRLQLTPVHPFGKQAADNSAVIVVTGVG